MKAIKLLLLVISVNFYSQVLIKKADDNTTSNVPDSSAMLEIRASDKGVIFPVAALTSLTDTSGFTNLEEGTIVLNTTTNATHPGIPTSRPALAVWDGNRWMMTYTKENVILDLDKVRNFTFQNIGNGVDVSVGTYSSGSNPHLNTELGDGTTGWTILINTDNHAKKPAFEFDPTDADQRLVIDVEGMASVNGQGFSYAIGIFVDDKLVSAKKFFEHDNNDYGCFFQKYNMRAILEPGMFAFTRDAGVPYNIKVGVRGLPRETNVESSYSSIGFGKSASGCINLNVDNARAYMNVLTIERRHIN